MPRPALWPHPRPQHQPHAYDGVADDDAPRPSPGRRKLSWIAVSLMVAGVVLLAVAAVAAAGSAAVAVGTAVVGVLLGLVGLGLAIRGRIFDEVSESD